MFNLDAYLGVDWHPDEKLDGDGGIYGAGLLEHSRGGNHRPFECYLDKDSIVHGPFVKVQYGF